MNFHISTQSMLDRYGVDLKVWPKAQTEVDYVAGVKAPMTAQADPETRHEPVLPFSSRSAGLVALYAGGAQLDVDLLWLSTGDYPKNTVVEVPTQGGKYRVVGKSNYKNYSDLVVYQLKGDDEHSDTGLN